MTQSKIVGAPTELDNVNVAGFPPLTVVAHGTVSVPTAGSPSVVIGPFAFAPGSSLLAVILPTDLPINSWGIPAGPVVPGGSVTWGWYNNPPGDPANTRSIGFNNATAGPVDVDYWILQVGP